MSASLDNDFIPTKSDEVTQRVARLALLFMNAKRPLTTGELLEAIYMDDPAAEQRDPDSLKIQLLRDCARLDACGIHITHDRGRLLTETEVTWELDQTTSIATSSQLTVRDVVALQVLCAPQIDDPTFPWPDELREALLYIGRSFDQVPDVVGWELSAGDSKAIAQIARAAELRQPALIAYEPLSHEAARYLVCPFALFPLLGHTYFVAAELARDSIDTTGDLADVQRKVLASRESLAQSLEAALAAGPIKTFRGDRLLEAQVVEGAPQFEIPADFDVLHAVQYLRHPFQIGATTHTATFELHDTAAWDELSLEQDYGFHLYKTEASAGNKSRLLADIDYANEEQLIVWAISRALVPLAPATLVNAYATYLEEAIQHAS